MKSNLSVSITLYGAYCYTNECLNQKLNDTQHTAEMCVFGALYGLNYAFQFLYTV